MKEQFEKIIREELNFLNQETKALVLEAMSRAVEAQWISVEDRLPEKGKLVLVFTRLKSRLTGKLILDNSKRWNVGLGDLRDFDYVTDWCELPQPPNKGEHK